MIVSIRNKVKQKEKEKEKEGKTKPGFVLPSPRSLKKSAWVSIQRTGIANWCASSSISSVMPSCVRSAVEAAQFATTFLSAAEPLRKTHDNLFLSFPSMFVPGLSWLTDHY